MSRPSFRKLRHRVASRLSQRGQSAVEYITVTAFAAMVLLVPDEDGNVVVVQLANAMKTYYNAFAYAISYSGLFTP